VHGPVNTVMDPMVLCGAAAFAASFVLSQKRRKKMKAAIRRQVGTNMRVRIRQSIESVYHEIGNELFCRAYRMTSPAFLELHRLLEPEILRIHKEYHEARRIRRKETRGDTKRIDVKTWKGFVRNGLISTSTCLAIALRYFAGGSLYDLAPLLGVGRSSALRSVWLVVEAVHCTEGFNLVFPADHDAKGNLHASSPLVPKLAFSVVLVQSMVF
jgi:hypothetical protein